MFKLLYRKFIQDSGTKFYQNRLGFIEDITKTFWCFFSVHSVELQHTNYKCAVCHNFTSNVGREL